jgi:hypothetical protein
MRFWKFAFPYYGQHYFIFFFFFFWWNLHLLVRSSTLEPYPSPIFFLKVKSKKWQNHFTKKLAAVTSWKSEDISQTRQELGLCISQRCLSDRKKSRRSGVWVRACTMQFMKHVLPKLIKPRRPGGQPPRAELLVHWAMDTLSQSPVASFTTIWTDFLLLIHSRSEKSKKKCNIFLIFHMDHTEECMPPLSPSHLVYYMFCQNHPNVFSIKTAGSEWNLTNQNAFKKKF